MRISSVTSSIAEQQPLLRINCMIIPLDCYASMPADPHFMDLVCFLIVLRMKTCSLSGFGISCQCSAVLGVEHHSCRMASLPNLFGRFWFPLQTKNSHGIHWYLNHNELSLLSLLVNAYLVESKAKIRWRLTRIG